MMNLIYTAKRMIKEKVDIWWAGRSPVHFLYPKSLAVPLATAMRSIGSHARKYLNIIYELIDKNKSTV